MEKLLYLSPGRDSFFRERGRKREGNESNQEVYNFILSRSNLIKEKLE